MDPSENGRPERRPLAERRLYEAGPGNLPPAGQVAPHGGVKRTEFFGGLKVPMQNGTGKRPSST